MGVCWAMLGLRWAMSGVRCEVGEKEGVAEEVEEGRRRVASHGREARVGREGVGVRRRRWPL